MKSMEKRSAASVFWSFAMSRKRYWLLPLVLVLLTLGAVVMLAQGSSLSPFVYTLF